LRVAGYARNVFQTAKNLKNNIKWESNLLSFFEIYSRVVQKREFLSKWEGTELDSNLTMALLIILRGLSSFKGGMEE